jgi:D-sedoheptulose 7-phosphate isomerase
MIKMINKYLFEVQHLLGQISQEEIERIIELLLEANRSRRQILIMGNGGSAATASHFACDLGKGVIVPNSPRFRVWPLTDNVPLITAWANDTAYENIYSEQLDGLIQRGDIVIAISGSGNSPNVVNAVRRARAWGATTVGLTGFDGGQLRTLVDYSLHVPSRNMEQVEDVHLVLSHLVCTSVRQVLQGQSSVAIALTHESNGYGNGASMSPGSLQGLAHRLIDSLKVTVCSLLFFDSTKENIVIRAISTAHALPTVRAVGQVIPLQETPILWDAMRAGRPLIFQQDEPTRAMADKELRLASSDHLLSGMLLPIQPNGEVIGTVLLGEMRSWQRRSLTEESLVQGMEIVKQWRSASLTTNGYGTSTYAGQERQN